MRKTKKQLPQIKRYLFNTLDLEAIGPEGLALRFTLQDLRILASEAGQLTAGTKLELAAKIIAVGRPQAPQSEAWALPAERPR